MRVKTKEIKVIQSKCDGVHWENESVYERDEYNQIRDDFREYKLAYRNMGIPMRLITRRVAIPY